VREQVITPRAGRVGAGSKGRGAVSVQRPNTRKTSRGAQKDSRQKGFEWKSALPYVPAALKTVLAVALGLLLYLGYRTAVSASFFKVKTVDVAGAARTSREEIRAEVLRLSNAGVWQADLEVIAKGLKGLPWVRDAVVTRVLPAGLRVRVTEREPRLIARSSAGKLVWVDDDGFQLGTATPGDEDFFVRGLDESAADDDARRDNRERMAVALALKADWERDGLSKRVSELDLGELRDVRVYLAGADSGLKISLIAQAGGAASADPGDAVARHQDYAKRFRDALRALDLEGRANGSKCVSYIVMTPGRHPVFGYHQCDAGESAGDPEAAAAAVGSPPPAASAPPAKDSKRMTTTHRPAKAEERKAAVPAPTNVAKRPRRVEPVEH
jgi:hypothetical protein